MKVKLSVGVGVGVGVGLVAILASAALSGCGASDDASREAAGDVEEVLVVDGASDDETEPADDDTTAEDSDAETSSDETSDTDTNPADDTNTDDGPENLFDAIVGSSLMPTRLCVENTIRAANTTIEWTRAGQSSSGLLKPGNPLCGQGGDAGPFRNDLLATLSFSGTPTMELWATNPYVGAPGAGVEWLESAKPRSSSSTPCGGSQGMSEGSTQTADNGVQRFVIKRLPDSSYNYKEFTITIEPSTNPTPDGSYRKCS